MNQVAFHLGEPIYWYLAQQQQIEALLETSHLQIEDADISATTEFIICLKKLLPEEDQIFILNLKKPS